MPQKANNQRINFATSKTLLDHPDFLEVQLKSFQDFFPIGYNCGKPQKRGIVQSLPG